VKEEPFMSQRKKALKKKQKGKALSALSVAGDTKPPHINPAGPVVARFGANPWNWSGEVQIFNTCREVAYGHFMHWGGIDDLNNRVPPNVWGDAPGWAYGAFLMKRFTGWDAEVRELALAYFMSTSNPYQAQVMRTRLRMPKALP
jgi:hypothetical protein